MTCVCRRRSRLTWRCPPGSALGVELHGGDAAASRAFCKEDLALEAERVAGEGVRIDGTLARHVSDIGELRR